MPIAPGRVCAQPGCFALVTGRSRCPDHTPKQVHRFTRRSGEYDREWRRLVAQAIREQPYCTICGTEEDLTGDHITPLSRGGTNTRDNIRVLCRHCNSQRGNR